LHFKADMINCCKSSFTSPEYLNKAFKNKIIWPHIKSFHLRLPLIDNTYGSCTFANATDQKLNNT
jgi:hypothetical protein